MGFNICSVCGLAKRGHICQGKMVAKSEDEGEERPKRARLEDSDEKGDADDAPTSTLDGLIATLAAEHPGVAESPKVQELVRAIQAIYNMTHKKPEEASFTFPMKRRLLSAYGNFSQSGGSASR